MEKKKKSQRKEWECPAFLPKCKSTPLGVCLHGEAEDHASPLNCHGGRQAGRQAGYFSSKLFSECKRTHTCACTHARRNHLLQTRSLLVPTGVTSNNGGAFLSSFFFFAFFVKSSDKHLNPTEGQSRDGQTDGQTGTVRFALSLTDLMRGTLSRVQHKVGPLCKCSSSSHDWLYNLERQTCMNTCAHTHTHTCARGDILGLQKSGQVLSETGQNAHANRAQMHSSDNSRLRLCSLHLCVIWEDDGKLLAALGRKGRRGVYSVSVVFFLLFGFAVTFCQTCCKCCKIGISRGKASSLLLVAKRHS